MEPFALNTQSVVTHASWREPAQARSRKRVEAILVATSELILSKGYENLKIREIADQAEVPVGTVYQFFDDKEAILACLLSRFFAWQDEEISQRFSQVNSIEGWLTATEGVIAALHQHCLENPVYMEIWRAAPLLKSVRHIDQESTERHTLLLADMLSPHLPNTVAEHEVLILCRLICQLTGQTLQNAFEMPEDLASEYIKQFEALIKARFKELTGA